MAQRATKPIGIFDSGMGGLTVAKTIADLMPQESIVYFGDTAHTPWGEKSVHAIQTYSTKICDVLLEHDCKVIVMACHTASTAAYDQVKAHVGAKAHVINVIEPTMNHIQKRHANKKLGLIGTKQTVRSGAYKTQVDLLNLNIQLTALATPLLVPLIEEGFSEKAVAQTILSEYLSHPELQNIDALILGCTHYPLLKRYIQSFYQNRVDIIDASEMTAQVLQQYLLGHDLVNQGQIVERIFYVSDYSEFFQSTAKVFFPNGIHLKPYALWE